MQEHCTNQKHRGACGACRAEVLNTMCWIAMLAAFCYVASQMGAW